MRARVLALLLLILAIAASARAQDDGEITLRVATFNIEDVRTADLANPDHPRLRRIAEVIQRLRPDVILLNEIAYDGPGAPGYKAGEAPGQNARRFVERFLTTPQADGLEPLRYRAFMAPVNTGIASGFDLDKNGRIVNSFPSPPAAPHAQQTDAAREYGNDCWGFGAFPGQYGMALLIADHLTLDEEKVRTFRLFPWDYMPSAMLPEKEDGSPWYDEEERKYFRLSSKSHWDVPVTLPNSATIHFLCSHPTPPVFDGPEDRNGRRNRDEIRFWADYIARRPYFVDDMNIGGPLELDASFVVLGDLNADPEKGDSLGNPIRDILFSAPGLNSRITPASDLEIPGLAPTDTARFKLRVDYVLPSDDLGIAAAGIYREVPSGGVPAGGDSFPSDHYPVWMDLVIRPPARLPAAESP